MLDVRNSCGTGNGFGRLAPDSSYNYKPVEKKSIIFLFISQARSFKFSYKKLQN